MIVERAFTLLPENSPVYRWDVAGINGLVTGVTLLIPSYPGRVFVPQSPPILRLTAVAGTGILLPIIRIGQSPNYNTLVALVTLSGLTVAGRTLITTLNTPTGVIDMNTEGISMEVQTVGTGFTLYTLAVYLVGFVV